VAARVQLGRDPRRLLIEYDILMCHHFSLDFPCFVARSERKLKGSDEKTQSPASLAERENLQGCGATLRFDRRRIEP